MGKLRKRSAEAEPAAMTEEVETVQTKSKKSKVLEPEVKNEKEEAVTSRKASTRASSSKKSKPTKEKALDFKKAKKMTEEAPEAEHQEVIEDEKTAEEGADVQTVTKGKRKWESLPTIAPGTVVVGRVDLENTRIKLPLGTLLVQFRGGVGKRFGRVDLTQVQEAEKWTDNPFEGLKHGQFVKCAVLKSNPNPNGSSIVELSMRPSLLEAGTRFQDEKARESFFEEELVKSNMVPAHDQVVTGYVVSANEKGCFIRTTRNLTGRVLLKNLSQGFVKDVPQEFPMGKLVAGRVLSSDETTGKFELTLRSSAVVGESEQRWALSTLTKGTIVDGVVHRIIPAGVLVMLPSAGGLTGLCYLSQVFDEDDPINFQTSAGDKRKKQKQRHHKSDATAASTLDEEVKQKLRAGIMQTYRVGDLVKCLVLEIDTDAKRVQLGMKPSYFQDFLENGQPENEEELESSEEEVEIDGDENGEADDKDQSGDSGESDEEERGLQDEESEQGKDSDVSDDEEATGVSGERELGMDEDEDDEPPLTLQDALKETGIPLKSTSSQTIDLAKRLAASKNQHLSVEADEEGSSSKNRLNNKRRDALKRKAEASTTELEDRLVANAAPETTEEFERALVSQRNSSMVWIQYISLLVSMGELEDARAVGERALKAISAELEEERNNVWSALLSMELQFGSLELAKALFSRMVRNSEEKWAYLTLCDAYCSLPPSYPDRLKLAEEAIRGAKKAAKQQSAKVWIRHFRLKFDCGDMVEGRKLLKEALRFVPKHKQVKVMLNFARLEYSHENGDIERGRTIMEGILDNYPKRTDVWHIFLDLEAKFGTPERVRTLYERALSMKMSTKKVKSLFKKWLQFESGPQGGGEAYMESVKERARQFVASLVGMEEESEDEGNIAQ